MVVDYSTPPPGPALPPAAPARRPAIRLRRRCGEAVQEGGQGDSGDLEDADGGGEQSLRPRRRVFRKLKAPELMKDVCQGAIYNDGIVIETDLEKVAA